ncbi:MAG: BCCT family transporter [Desulfobacterales bacterium]|nr:BCCT family transporter [Desulfobacterales bacterium]
MIELRVYDSLRGFVLKLSASVSSSTFDKHPLISNLTFTPIIDSGNTAAAVYEVGGVFVDGRYRIKLIPTWWISWTPFVGIFMTRIPQGRTMRELIIGCLFVPTIFGILWFAVFGGTALHLEYFAGADIGQAMVEDPAQGTFLLFEQLPFAELTSVLTILLLLTFLVTSADSATFVVSMLTSSGDLEPPLRTKVLWGCTLAAASLVLLAGGGMQALQASTLVFAFPFALVLILMAVSLHIRLSIQEKSDRL